MVSASIGVRSDTGEPVITLFRMYRIIINEMLQCYSVSDTNSRETGILIALNQIQIINPRLSRLDVELTDVANRLVEGAANYSQRKEIVESWDVDRLSRRRGFDSPDCRRMLYVYRKIHFEREYLLLDLSKKNCRRLNISYPRCVHWSEDSKLLGLTFQIRTKLEVHLYDCENETDNFELTVEPLPGELVALQWLSQNNYSACVDVKVSYRSPRLIYFYKMGFTPNNLIFSYSLKFNIHMTPSHYTSVQ